jgi:hypothetical protein
LRVADEAMFEAKRSRGSSAPRNPVPGIAA